MNKTNTTELKEQKDHGTTSFPCGLYQIFENTDWNGFKHHWHDEVELLYFMKGKFQLDVNMETFHIDRECFFFIHAGDLHTIRPEGKGVESAIVFHPRILSFDNYDIAQSRILQPLLNGRLTFPRCLYQEDAAFSKIKAEYLDIVNVFYQNGSYFSKDGQTITEDLSSQLFIRAGLLKILGILSAYHLLNAEERTDDSRVEIIKNSLAYIHSHYQDKCYLGDIARQANMNEQYFCRLFKKVLGKTPISYINDYRVGHAITLLQDTDLSVMDVCLDSGFHNLGNFLREFRKKTGATPLQYRKDFQAGILKKSK